MACVLLARAPQAWVTEVAVVRAFFRSFSYAAKGLQIAIVGERNFRFHLCAAVYVILFSFFYAFSAAEYCLLILAITSVLSAELLNSALERVVENPSPGKYQMAGRVKDVAAAAVLVVCIGAAVCGFLLFWDIPTFLQIYRFFVQQPFLFLLLLVSVGASIWFIFGLGQKDDRKF